MRSCASKASCPLSQEGIANKGDERMSERCNVRNGSQAPRHRLSLSFVWKWQRQTALVRDIVADARNGISQSPSLIAPSEPRAERSTRAYDGLGRTANHFNTPPGIALVDRLCEAQDAKDQRRAETLNGPDTGTQGAALRGARQDYRAYAIAEAQSGHSRRSNNSRRRCSS